MTCRTVTCSLLAVLLLCPLPLHAAAWLQEQGRGQLIQNVTLYRTDTYIDPDGVKISQPTYLKLEYNPYLEYGWTPDITVGMSPSFQKLYQGSEDNIGLADTEFFLRYGLWKGEDTVLSIQPGMKIPGPYDDDDPLALGQGQIDAELRLLLGKSFEAFGEHHFFNIESAYRKRMESPSDEYRVDTTLGMHVVPEWMIMGQVFSNFSVNDASTSSSGVFLSNAADNDLVKGQLSAVWSYDERTQMQVGMFQHLHARNTGDDGGFLFSIWRKF